jgi:signal transduction histidine kinase
VAVGLLLLLAAVVWLATAALSLALIGWRVPRRRAGPGAALVAIWLAVALVVLGLWSAPAGHPWTLAPAASVIVLAGLLGPRAAARYRTAPQSTRVLWLSLAVIVPALLLYPPVHAAADGAQRHRVETVLAPQVVQHPVQLRARLEEALRQIDRFPDLERLVSSSAPGGSTEPAFLVWSQTALARARLTSAVELYAPSGALVSRFALNVPEYEPEAQTARSESCTWQLFGEVRPFGSEERRGLHAERALCPEGPDGPRAGTIYVHVMLDYGALPFVSPESPYAELLGPAEPAEPSARDIHLVVYGWSLRPIYASGPRVWPIDQRLFERIYASRQAFWTRLENGGGRYHVHFANDRAGIYAIGYQSLTLFDHFVHLAELVTLAGAVYAAGLALAAAFGRVARGRRTSGRELLREVRASFYRKLLLAFVAATVVPVLALALLIRAYFASRLRADVHSEAARTAVVAQRTFEELAALLRLAGLSEPPINDDLMVEISQMIDRDVNLFRGAGLVATSERDLFASGLLPTRTPAEVYRRVVLERQPAYVGEDRLGGLPYILAAAPARAAGDQAVITVPLASRQREIEREIDELDRGVHLAALALILIGSAVGLPLAERIADPVRRLTRAAGRIARGELDTRVAVRSVDELRRLVDAFNSMAAELEAQRARLERAAKLEAWAEMARQVAHEIKNPLTPIQLAAEHLRRVHADRGRPLDPVLDSCVESILGQVRLLRQIAGEFASFASAPTARPAEVPVGRLIDEVLEPYRAGLPGRIEIRTEVPPEVPALFVDRALVARALVNVIENALHAMPGGGVLSIAAEPLDGAVRLSITDTGVGMDAEALAHIFEPYFSTKTTGTGLGLTIARRNVELNGGTIAVTSARGAGTTVTITLPAARAAGREAGG